jgi:hypothetical protein
MTQEKLASLLREETKKQEVVSVELRNNLAKCEHVKVVSICSYFGGSSFYDYTDCNPEYRKCLVCGRIEAAPTITKVDFKLLKNPYKQFEYNVFGKDQQWAECPFNTSNFEKTSLEELEKWVDENGKNI